ncbi:MAG: hypothetical protein QOE92_2224 [Chloroflexota bacterium]|jgi:hypothetical protein|nr:hypothetical protein [Chloroflexota bacterium]
MTLDPVVEAEKYRNLLLELAGEDDPSDTMLSLPGEVRRIVAEAGADLRTRPAEGEWSVLELLGHLVDGEMVVGVRLRWTLADTDPRLEGYDQDHWVTAQAYNDADPEDLLRVLEALRPLNVALFRAASSTDRARVGLHAERGEESLETTYRMLAGHDRFHLDQMRDTLEQVRSSAR